MNVKNLFEGKRIDTKERVSGYLVETHDKAYIILSAEAGCSDGENTDLYATEWYEVYPDTVCRNSEAEDKKNILSKEECDIFNTYLQGDIRVAFGNSDWNHIYYKIVGENSSDFAEKCMDAALED